MSTLVKVYNFKSEINLLMFTNIDLIITLWQLKGCLNLLCFRYVRKVCGKHKIHIRVCEKPAEGNSKFSCAAKYPFWKNSPCI